MYTAFLRYLFIIIYFNIPEDRISETCMLENWDVLCLHSLNYIIMYINQSIIYIYGTYRWDHEMHWEINYGPQRPSTETKVCDSWHLQHFKFVIFSFHLDRPWKLIKGCRIINIEINFCRWSNLYPCAIRNIFLWIESNLSVLFLYIFVWHTYIPCTLDCPIFSRFYVS